MFINAEALHAFDIVGDEGCRMNLSGAGLQHARRARGQRLCPPLRHAAGQVRRGEDRAPCPDVEWQQAVLKSLREAFLTYDEGKYGFELLVRARLTECLWHIVRNMRAAMREYEGVYTYIY